MRKYDPIKHVLTGNMGGSVLTLGKTEQKGWRYTAICVHYDGANDAHTTLFTKYVTGRNAKYVNGDLCGRWDDGYGSTHREDLQDHNPHTNTSSGRAVRCRLLLPGNEIAEFKRLLLPFFKEGQANGWKMDFADKDIIKQCLQYGYYTVNNNPTTPSAPVTDSSDDIVNNGELKLIKQKYQIILYGPPGTGKTYSTKELAINLISDNNREYEQPITVYVNKATESKEDHRVLRLLKINAVASGSGILTIASNPGLNYGSVYYPKGVTLIIHGDEYQAVLSLSVGNTMQISNQYLAANTGNAASMTILNVAGVKADQPAAFGLLGYEPNNLVVPEVVFYPYDDDKSRDSIANWIFK